MMASWTATGAARHTRKLAPRLLLCRTGAPFRCKSAPGSFGERGFGTTQRHSPLALASGFLPRQQHRQQQQPLQLRVAEARRRAFSDRGRKTGEEHHALFREQLADLHREQQGFGLPATDTADQRAGGPVSPPPLSSGDLEGQLEDWNTEQVEVFGEPLSDRTDGKGGEEAALVPGDCDREARYGFTAEERASWGRPAPDPAEMRAVLEGVAHARRAEVNPSLQPQAAASEGGAGRSSGIPPPGCHDDRHEDHHGSFTHLSGDGTSIHMVDVGAKAVTTRTARARSEVWLPPSVVEALGVGNASDSELVGPKGPIFATARIAGIMAAKKTSDLVPLCHPLPLDQVELDIGLSGGHAGASGLPPGGRVVRIDCTCRVTHKTGVEMEALVGATTAALTIYDMTKAVSHSIRILDTRLVGKTGGKRTVLDGREEGNEGD
ncbi:unnamed protein product [Pseudo-nitzschia multistriata]|uniref:cyclic pyranopterin monophosphate synthase n=1 Tax=Pseudo-nitzschia multistriata TaxID=183589 RepID=A0A448Z100_9STRA|nr:unnamed protein product [Pseudo-nitzschia multistriata]